MDLSVGIVPIGVEVTAWEVGVIVTQEKRDTMNIHSRLKAWHKALAMVASVGLLASLAACGEAPAPSGGSGNASGGQSSSAQQGDLDVAAYNKVIESAPVADAATVEANAWAKSIKEAGELKVGGVLTSALFSLQSTSDNQVRGFDAGLASMLSRYILGKDAVKVTVVDSSTRESVLSNGTVNAVLATYSITDKRKEQVDFAGPYYVSRQAIMVKADNTDITGVKSLAGKRVGVQAGSTGPQVVKEVAPKAEVQEFQTDAEITQALRQGRIDAYVVDETLLLGDIVKNPNDFKIVGEPFGAEDPYGIGLPKGSDAAQFVNAWLENIEQSGQWKDLWKVTIGDRTGVKQTPEPPAIAKE